MNSAKLAANMINNLVEGDVACQKYTSFCILRSYAV